MSSLTAPMVPRLGRVRTTPGAFPDNSEIGIPTEDTSQLSLSQAVYARKAEYTHPKRVRVKVGSWNVAGLSGTDKDVGGWFVGGRGIAEALAGLESTSIDEPHTGVDTKTVESGTRETVDHQEDRATKKKSTLPQGDDSTLEGGDDIGLYALGLQEVVDISSPAEALRLYADPSIASKWKKALAAALPPGYRLVAEQQLMGLLLLVYASEEIASSISSVDTSSVSTGLMGYMSNKGAVAARLVLGDTTRLVFINSHLAAGAEKANLDRRNWDAAQVASRLKFDSFDDGSGSSNASHEGIGNEDFAWWFGDLNYRLDKLPGDDVRRLLMLHTRNEYDIGQRRERAIENEIERTSSPIVIRDREAGNRSSLDSVVTSSSDTAVDDFSNTPSISTSTTVNHEDMPDPYSDPTSLQTTLSSLLPHDQLHQQQASRKAFHDGWREGPINFLPTYKYDVGSVGMFDSSEKKRGPSWCDRIIFRTRRDRQEYEKKVREEEISRKRDEEMKSRGVDTADDDEILFDYDPETDGADERLGDYDEQLDMSNHDDVGLTKTSFEDTLRLDIYTSHQRVLSSDHKPLSAIFELSYDAFVPELKAKVHQEVVREHDRAENEARPGITIAVDHHDGKSLLMNKADSSAGRTDPFNPDTSEYVDFGDVRYDQSISRSITIANTGRVPARFNFVDKPLHENLAGVSQSWLSMRFDHPDEETLSAKQADIRREKTLEPGDAMNVILTVRIEDTQHLRSLNEGREKIEDVLVLRVADGRDHFLPLRGTWMQSCFGRNIDELIRIPEGGVRTMQHQHSSKPTSFKEQSIKWSAPRELFRLTETTEELVESVAAETRRSAYEGANAPPWDIDTGWPFAPAAWRLKDGRDRDALKVQVRESLDSNQPLFSSCSAEVSTLSRLEVVAETLLTFLRTLQDGIITEPLWIDLEREIAANEKAKRSLPAPEEQSWILDVLSNAPNHNICFVFLTSMLARVASEISPVHPPLPPPPSESPPVVEATPPSSPKSGKRKSASVVANPATERRRLVDQALSRIFSDAMIRGPTPPREKERKIAEERMKRVVEVFLKTRWESET
ncbi:MAG: hypothetical protein M1837_000654 [Sclerophora amabilis]|nr:MAG: hypothetical protein M1837_000654 [Sclerophora amabilis]